MRIAQRDLALESLLKKIGLYNIVYDQKSAKKGEPRCTFLADSTKTRD